MTSNILTNIRAGLFTFLVGSSNTFRTAITQVNESTSYYNLYYHLIPMNLPSTEVQIVAPMVVMNILPLTPSRDSVSKFYDFEIQFNIGADNSSEAESIAEYLTDLLEDSESSLTISGYSLIEINRGLVTPAQLIENVWNVIVTYSLKIQK